MTTTTVATPAPIRTGRRVAATGPLPPDRAIPTAEAIRQQWATARPDGPIPAVLNLFGDATGALLGRQLAEVRSVDDCLAIADEATAYGDHDLARVALDHARSLALRRVQTARIEALEAALAPSALEQALAGVQDPRV